MTTDILQRNESERSDSECGDSECGDSECSDSECSDSECSDSECGHCAVESLSVLTGDGGCSERREWCL